MARKKETWIVDWRFSIAYFGKSTTEDLWLTTKIIYLRIFLTWVAMNKLHPMVVLIYFCVCVFVRESMIPVHNINDDIKEPPPPLKKIFYYLLGGHILVIDGKRKLRVSLCISKLLFSSKPSYYHVDIVVTLPRHEIPLTHIILNSNKKTNLLMGILYPNGIQQKVIQVQYSCGTKSLTCI